MINNKEVNVNMRKSFINTILSFFIFVLSFAVYVFAEKEIDKENENRIKSFFIANELRQSSDDLTKMVRAYIATGDKHFKAYYEEVLAIRDGKKPRPVNYRYIYWDLVEPNNVRPTQFSNKSEPFVDRLKKHGLTQVEFNKLMQAKMNSDALTKIEFEAMRLIEQDGSEVQKAKNKEEALKLVYNENYLEAKASIMRPINDFYILIDKRTSQAVQQAVTIALLLRILFIILTFIFIYMLLRLYNKFYITLGGTVSELHEHIERISKGDFSKPIYIKKGMDGSVLSWIAQTQMKLLDLINKNKNLTNLYAALSQCNQDIVRSTNKEELFFNICRDAIEFGELKMAWIGIKNESTLSLDIVSYFGEGSGYLKDFIVSIDPLDARSKGPSGSAFLNKEPYWCQDFLNDPHTALWHTKGIEYGWRASAALPLYCKDEVIGVFTLYAKDVNAFDEKIKNLLEEMALDIGYALDNFEHQRERDLFENALAEKNSLLTSIIDNSPIRIFWKDKDLNYLGCNRVFANDAGEEDSSTVIGKNDYQLCWSEQAELYRNDDKKVMDSGVTKLFFEEPQRTANGDIIWLSTSKVPLRNKDNEIVGIVGLYEDITSRKNAEIALKHEKETAQRYLDIVGVMIVVLDINKNVILINKKGCDILGYSSDEIIGRNWIKNFVPERFREEVEEVGEELFHREQFSFSIFENPILTKNGDERLISWNNTPLFDTEGNVIGLLTSGEDITERRANEERVHYLANFDNLTGLANRFALDLLSQNLLGYAKRHNDKLAVLFLDLDHFKDINDSLGHSMGDKLLVNASQRIKTILRSEDVIARLGGDEFIVILPNIDPDHTSMVAKKILDAFKLQFEIDNHELSISASIGIAMFPDDGNDFETLSKNADTAMYRAKEKGRNTFCFYTQEMQENSIRHLELSNALRFALQREQLELHYQPQISLHDHSIIGAESLLRWKHPEYGNISPVEFIPIAEENGTILEIGTWVLKTAIKTVKEWMEAGMKPITIAVNLSAVQFRFIDLDIMITKMLEEYGVDPKYLEIELTESVAMQDPQKAIDIMSKLHEKGIKMSIDDFGTGYSSLSYLKKFNVTKLKIDQSFVRDLNVDEDDKAIVNTIINMAKTLGLKTIAEGVETVPQLEYLKQQGCDEIQGYYFSKPLPLDDFILWCHNFTND